MKVATFLAAGFAIAGGIPLKSGAFSARIRVQFFRWGEAPDEPARADARPTFGWQPGSLPYVHRRDDVRQKIRRHAHVGVADKNQIVLRQFFEPGELRDFGVGANEFFADDELRFALWIFGDDFPDDFADGIIRVRDTKEDLRLAGIMLIEPALKGFGGGGVAAFERFEQ